MDLQLQLGCPHLYGQIKKELRIAAFLPEGRRETRGRAWILPVCAEN
jgi:hypothetical protein